VYKLVRGNAIRMLDLELDGHRRAPISAG
jgi:hypothetical protein